MDVNARFLLNANPGLDAIAVLANRFSVVCGAWCRVKLPNDALFDFLFRYLPKGEMLLARIARCRGTMPLARASFVSRALIGPNYVSGLRRLTAVVEKQPG